MSLTPGVPFAPRAHVVISPAAPLAVSLACRPKSETLVDRQIESAHRYVDFSLYTRPPPSCNCFLLRQFQQPILSAPGGSMYSFPRRFVFVVLPFLLLSASGLHAQRAAGTIAGTVTDASGAVVPGATVTIENPVSGLSRTAKTDSAGHYQFNNLPLNPYHLVANAPGFTTFSADVSVRSSVPVAPAISLQVGGASTTVTVTGGDLVENDSSLHTDLDRHRWRSCRWKAIPPR